MFNKDFGKNARDLLTQGFPNPFEFDVSSDTGCVSFSTSGSLNEDGTFDMDASPSFSCETLKGTTFDISLSSEGSHNLKITNKDYLRKGVKAFVSVDCEQKVKEGTTVHNQSGSLGVDYAFSRGTFSSKFAFPSCCSLSVPKTTLGFVYLYDKFAGGVEGVISYSENDQKEKEVKFDKLSGNLQMDIDATSTGSFGVTASKGVIDLNAKYFLRRPKFIFATEINYAIRPPTVVSQEPPLTAKIAFGKTFAAGGIGKVILSNKPEIGFSYKKEVCDDVTLTVGTRVPFGTFTHKTGVSIDIDV